MEQRTTRQRVVRRLANVLLIAGGLVLAYPFWSAAYAHYHQDRLASEYRQASATFGAKARAVTSVVGRQPSPEVRARRLAAAFKRGLEPGDPIGRLVIPRIGLDRIVAQGATGAGSLSPAADTVYLRGGPVHHGVTPLPGAGEPFAVAGHRTTYGAPFYHLDALRRGDAIVVDTPYGRFTYRVAKTTTVLPSDVAVLYDRGYALVLTTCTPRYSASHRLVVWATAGPFRLK